MMGIQGGYGEVLTFQFKNGLIYTNFVSSNEKVARPIFSIRPILNKSNK